MLFGYCDSGVGELGASAEANDTAADGASVELGPASDPFPPRMAFLLSGGGDLSSRISWTCKNL